MTTPKLASFRIQIGTIVGLPLTEKQSLFHSSLIELIHDRKFDFATSENIPISYFEAVHSPDVLKTRILGSLNQVTAAGLTIYCMLDLSYSPYFIIRDPLLLEMFNAISFSIEHGLCLDFTILLPKMPGEDGAFRYAIKSLCESHSKKSFEIRLISNDGTGTLYKPEINFSVLNISDYLKIRGTAYAEAQSKIEKKSIRRLGHFESNGSNDGESRCRHYSYLHHNCESEMQQLFQKWWETIDVHPQTILFDLKNNKQMKDIVVAHAVRLNLMAEDITKVISDGSLSSKIKKHGPVALVLDAIESGTTLRHYIGDLEPLGIQPIKDIFVRVNKHGKLISDLDLRIHGLIVRTRESVDGLCEQCGLELPKTSDAVESFLRIRSYDMHYMISKCGWESEPLAEAPSDKKLQYRNLPNFEEILRNFGDWIGYKLYTAIINRGIPEDWFIIHPAEAASSSLAQRINDCVENELTIISIPRNKITSAQENENSWGDVLNISRDDQWIKQLNSMRGKNASAIILDIFNGSGETCKSLIRLLRCYDLNPQAYCCFVDFNPSAETQAIDEVHKISLYEWHNPRMNQSVK